MITGEQTRVPGAALSHLVYKTKKIAVVGDALIPQPNPRNVASPVNASAFVGTNPPTRKHYFRFARLFRKSNLSEPVALPSLCWPSIGPLQDGIKRGTKGLAP